MPVISRDAPAFASNDKAAPGLANDHDYSTQWRSYAIPAWLAYDLSSVPARSRTKVVAVYYNASTRPYFHDASSHEMYNNLRDYTIDASKAAGAAQAPPESSWTTLVRVTKNAFHSRQHVLDLTGYNWIRMHVTASDGQPQNDDAGFNFDVHDASHGVCDDWIFFGDQQTEDGMSVTPTGDVGTFAQLVAAKLPDRFPLAECGGMLYATSDDARKTILGDAGWLAQFPGRYVGLGFGWADAQQGVSDPLSFHDIESDLIKAVIAAKKVPVVPKIPWAADATQRATIQKFNQQIDALYNEFPEVVPGPDLYATFENRTELFNQIWVSEPAGADAFRKAWADAMLANVYR
jgi:hypothetical protein